MELEEKIINVEKIYQGKIIGLEKLTVLLPNGQKSTRDVVRHPGAAMIIPITDDGCVIMVRQYRVPHEKVVLEMPAGKLDENEEPAVCAERELKEETGLTAKEIKYVFSIDTTVGFSDETIHIYLATGLTAGELKTDEDEFLEVEKIKIDELINLIFEGKITDAKTIIGAFVAQRTVLSAEC